jgi:protein SCO1/2
MCSRFHAAAVVAALLILGIATFGYSQGAGDEPGILEKLGEPAALDSVLLDEEGREVTLRALIDKPTILTLNYFRCAGICTPLLNGVVETLNRIKLAPGVDFQVITVSFDPTDTPEIARQKRTNYLKQITRPFPPSGWRFLTGSAAATRAVADSVGFHYRAVEGGFVHAGVIISLTPAGMVSRYLYGTDFLPADVEMAVREAAAGQVRPTISRILSFCYSYDPQARRYTLNVTRIAGGATLLLAGGFVVLLLTTRSRSRKS